MLIYMKPIEKSYIIYCKLRPGNRFFADRLAPTVIAGKPRKRFPRPTRAIRKSAKSVNGMLRSPRRSYFTTWLKILNNLNINAVELEASKYQKSVVDRNRGSRSKDSEHPRARRFLGIPSRRGMKSAKTIGVPEKNHALQHVRVLGAGRL